MSGAAGYSTGRTALRRYLGRAAPDPRDLDRAALRAWLADRVAQAQHEPLFAARCALRDRLRAERDVLGPLVRAAEEAERAWASTAESAELTQLESDLFGLRRAEEGLVGALVTAEPERRPALEVKLAEVRARRAEREEQRARIEALAARRLATEARAALSEAEAARGIDRARAEVERAQQVAGRHTTRSGSGFERVARAVVEGHVVRAVTDRRDHVEVLENVTLGAARAELDFVVARVRAGRPAEVLAVVEAKADPSDVEHGFALRQENLAFFTGDVAGYDPALYRTSRYRGGRFDREVQHQGRVTFGPESFRWFRHDPRGPYLDRLFFVLRDRPLRGAPSSVIGRVLYRVSTDPTFDLADDAAIDRVRRLLREGRPALGALDVLGLYATSARLGQRIVLVQG